MAHQTTNCRPLGDVPYSCSRLSLSVIAGSGDCHPLPCPFASMVTRYMTSSFKALVRILPCGSRWISSRPTSRPVWISRPTWISLPWRATPGSISTSSRPVSCASSASSILAKVDRLKRLRGAWRLLPFFALNPLLELCPLNFELGTALLRPEDRPIVEPLSPSLLNAMRNRGWSVARLPAVIARPCSAWDQMAMSVVSSVVGFC